MSVGQAHRLALVATAILPVLGLVSGSRVLQGSSVALITSVLVSVPALHQAPRSRARTWGVHLLTLLGLAGALSIFSEAKIDAGLCVVMLGLFNRFLLRSGQRDDLIIVGSAGVLLAAATIVTPGFAFALLVLAFVPAALWAMLTSSILGLSERSTEPSVRRSSFHRLAARPVPALKGAVTGWGLALMVVGYVAVSFLPRFRFGHLLSPGGLMTFGGAGSEMRMDTGGVQTSGGNTVVLRVSAGPGVDSADLEGLYARVYALDRVEGANFVDTKGRLEPLEFERRGPKERTVQVSLRRLVPRNQSHPVAILGRSGPTQVYLRRPERYESGTWATRIAQASLDVRYEASLDALAEPEVPQELDALRAYEGRFLQLPASLDPRVPVLALGLAAGAQDREVVLRNILGHFGRGFRYTLDPIEGESDDPLSRFLFEAKQGHCELYAGALAVMLRAAGVPARVAAGYYGGWFNHRSRHLEMGSEDAHAWVEALVAGRWIWVDATPADARARRQHKSLAWILDLWDAAEALWYEHVIDFDEERRQQVIGDLGAGFGSTTSDLVSWFTGERAFGLRRPGWGWLGVAFAFIVAAAGGLAAWFWTRRHRLERLGARLRRWLDPAGASTGPLGVLASRQPPAARSSADRAVSLYEQARFGGTEPGPELAEIRNAIQDLERCPRGPSVGSRRARMRVLWTRFKR